ncbi:MAG TPA: DUF3857 domain-containing protein, partial [Puia sp.]|nr:DUF3857 domain-containing protein [Puia sp.]
MNRHALLCLLVLFRGFSGYCQDTVSTGYGHVLPEEFHPNSPVIDSNADVVVISDVGHAELLDSPRVDFGRIRYTRYLKMLIRNQKGVDAAKIKIGFDPDINGSGKLSSLRANTYNLRDGGVVKTPVDTADMYLNTEDNGDVTESFSFPQAGAGSIIEYTYTIWSGSIWRFHSWNFQSGYPQLKSEFTATIPTLFNYAVSRQGTLAIARTVDSARQHFGDYWFWVHSMVYNFHWTVKDVPALEPEPYVASMDDHLAGLRFQLSAYTPVTTGRQKTFLNSWTELNDHFYKNEAFGGIMTGSSHFLRRELREIVDDSLPDMDKAKKLFKYVRDNFIAGGNDVLPEDSRSI